MTGYSEDENGNVVLRMTREDYLALLVTLGFAAGAMQKKRDSYSVFGLLNRLLEGNPHYTPYEIPETER